MKKLKTRMLASRRLDIEAHSLHLQWLARVKDLDAQYPEAMTAAEAAEDFERCGALKAEKAEAARQLEAATDRRAKEWEAALGE